MEFSDYTNAVRPLAVYPACGANPIYPTLGLCGEAGEVAEKVKKVIRDHGHVFDDHRESIAKELGDVLWYVSQLAYELGYSLDDIAQMNIDKLTSRRDRGALHGEGDNR
jgi:NTP pyrophosphatase (non-canonical NTP hydrolase)